MPGMKYVLVWTVLQSNLCTFVLSGFLPCHVCKGCGASFVEKKCFDIHLKHSNDCLRANPRVFKCFKCHDTFSELHNLQQHIRRHELMKNCRPSFRRDTVSFQASQDLNSVRENYPLKEGNTGKDVFTLNCCLYLKFILAVYASCKIAKYCWRFSCLLEIIFKNWGSGYCIGCNWLLWDFTCKV